MPTIQLAPAVDTYSLNIHKIYKLASSSNQLKPWLETSGCQKVKVHIVGEIKRCLNIPLGMLCYIRSKPSATAKQPLIN